jgi:hypothetical protein
VAVGSCYVSIKNGVADLSREPLDCPILRDQVMEQAQLIEDYLYPSDAAHANPPEDTGHGPLRQIYSTLQRMDHCSESWKKLLPTPAQARTLLFFRNVMKNYGRYFKTELAALSGILARVQVDPPIRLPDLQNPQTSRKEVVDFYNKIEDAAYNDHHELDGLSGAEKAILEKAHDRMGTFFIQLECSPLSWVEDYGDRSVEAPACGEGEDS